MWSERVRRAAPRAALGAALLAFFSAVAFGLSGEANIVRLNSSIFDLDVGRVVHDWTTAEPGRRTHAHPLYKLLLAPIGSALRGAGLSGTDAARAIAVAAMTLQALLVGVLASQLAGGDRRAEVAAALLCGASFSSVLLAAIPDAASISCLATAAPLAWLGSRAGRPFDRAEAAGWAALGAFGIAVTLTQGMHWAIALVARATWLRPPSGGPSAARLAAAVAGAAALVAGAAALQERLYPGTGYFVARRSPLGELRSFGRLDRFAEGALPHALLVANHFAGVNFAAPMPAYSDYVIREWRQPYWSLSLEEAGAASFAPAQRALYAAWLALALPAALWLGRFDRRFAAPLACIAGQFALHLAYGREYILYSPNWHGAVVAVLVGGVFLGRPRSRPALAAVAGGLALALALNSVAVMNRVYREVEAGLEASLRDERGRLRAAPRRRARRAAGLRAAPVYHARRERRRSAHERDAARR